MTDSTDIEVIRQIELVHHHSLEVRQTRDRCVLHIVSQGNRASVSIHVSDRGISLCASGGDLTLETTGAISIDAQKLSLHGREGLSLSSDADASLRVSRDFEAQARIHNIHASLGNVNIRANDDVCLDGERIRLNSPNARPLTPSRNGEPRLGSGSHKQDG